MNTETARQIPLSSPTIGERETEYVVDCLRSTWISSAGEYLDRFEDAFRKVTGTRHAIACSNGTTALHLALLSLGVKPNDEVIVPTLTFVAVPNSVAYCGGKPVLVDVDPGIWSIDVSKIERQINSKTRGIIAVHLRGHPADMDVIMDIARRHGLFVIEDAAQAHGAKVHGQTVGSIGNIGTFSFFGNKIMTTGEGGMITTNDDDAADRIRLLKNQGMTKEHRYWHPVVGYNCRLTNIQAAIGLAQIERLPQAIVNHRRIAGWYREELKGLPGISWQEERNWAHHIWWQFVAVMSEDIAPDREAVLQGLQQAGIDARRLYYPMHQVPIYRKEAGGRQYPVADSLAARGICLPTWNGLERQDVHYICEQLKKCTDA